MTAPDTSAPAVAAMIERLNARLESIYDPRIQGAEWQKDGLCQLAASMLSELMRERDEARGKAMELKATIQRIAKVAHTGDGSRTFYDTMKSLEWVDDACRLALSNPNQETK